MAVIKETIPFNYDELFAKTRDKFIERGYDTQPGSNTMQLVTAMSYLVSMLNVNTAVNINEMLLTLARKRNNILQDARLLGYEPGNKVSYQYEVELKLKGGDFILPKYSEFISGEKKYYYLGDLIQVPDAPEGQILTIIVKEGELFKASEDNELSIIIEEFNKNGVVRPQYYVDIPYTDVEEDGIEAFLTYYDEEGNLFNKEEWKKIDTFTVDSDTILKKQFYRLNNIDYNTPRVFFKLPNTDDDLRLGTKIEMNILKSSGVDGEIIDDLTTTLDCEINKVTMKIQGTSEENSESIKYNAPLFWNSANRAVTKNDYKSICERLTTIDKSFIWDGNDEYPKIPGKIWFSFIPSTYKRTFSNDVFKTSFLLDNLNTNYPWFLGAGEINNVFEYLNTYKIMTLETLHRHPMFLDFSFDIEILKYDIISSESEQNERIFNIINTYFNDDLNPSTGNIENFETSFFKSNLIKRISKEVTDITGVNLSMSTDIVIYKEQIVEEGDSRKILINLGLPYDDYYSLNGYIIIDNMPVIDTGNFLNNRDLKVDWSGIANVTESVENTETILGEEGVYINKFIVGKGVLEEFVTGEDNSSINHKSAIVLELNIKLGNYVVGKYKIFNDKILIELNVGGLITPDNIDKKILNVKYKTDNIQMSKNTIPRLKRVKFL